MKNIITTVPKSRFKTFAQAEKHLRRSTGDKWFWTCRVPRPPKANIIGSLCYIIYDGRVRGYFDIVDVDLASNWKWHKDKHQEGHVIVMANWHPVHNGPEMTGFQGWRYTELRP